VRFYLKDESLADDEAVSGTDGVIDVAKAGGQYQVVIGAEVGDVYDAIVAQLPGLGGGEVDSEAEAAPRPTTAVGWIKFGFSSLIGVITGSMIPVIGVLAASGILKGILALLVQFKVVADSSDTYQIISAMADSMFYFLPIIIGFTAARRLGSDPIVVAIIGGVLAYPSLAHMANPDYIVKADNPAGYESPYHVVAQLGNTIFNTDFFGIPVSLPQTNAYAYSIFPIIVAAWLAAKIEPYLKKWIPAVVRSIFAPLLEIFIVSTLVLVVFGPIVMFISGAIASGVNAILGFNHALAGLLIGGFYQCLVIFGLHWAVIPIISQQIAGPDASSPLNAIVSATMIAQGGGALAIWLKVRNAKIKRMAGPATISAFCGVTEPAMYGLNLKYGRVFITASIGGAVGGLLTGLLKVNMWGFTGAFVGFPSFVNPKGIDGSFTGFWIASLAALAVVVVPAVLVQSLALVAWARLSGVGVPLDAGPWALYTVELMAVDLALCAFHVWLAAVVENQLIGVGVGLIGSFIGVYMLLAPASVARLVPWGYYAVISCARMEGATARYTAPAPGWVAGFLVLSAVLFAVATRRLDRIER